MAFDKPTLFNLNDEIKDTLTFKAKALGMTNSDYVRNAIMNDTIIVNNDNSNCVSLLGRVNNFTGNFNQISHNLNLANNYGFLNDIDYDTLMDILTEMNNNIRSTLNAQ